MVRNQLRHPDRVLNSQRIWEKELLSGELIFSDMMDRR